MVAVLPDHVRESFEPSMDHGKARRRRREGLRYLAWTWDPDSRDDTYLTDYAFLLRQDGAVSVEHDRHVEVSSRAQWLEWMSEAGIPADGETDPWRGEVFIGVRC